MVLRISPFLGKQAARVRNPSAPSACEDTMTSDDLHAQLNDAGRTALEIIRRERAGDVRSIVDLVSTYSDDGKGLIIGAMAGVVNHALGAFDQLATSHGEPLRGDDLLKVMAVTLEPPDEDRPAA